MKKTACLCFFIIYSCISVVFSDVIKLKNGDVIHGMVMETRDEVVIIQHEDLGKLMIDKSKVVSVETISTTSPEATETQKEEYFLKNERDFSDLNAFSKKAKDLGWKASLNISVDNSYGNTDEQAWRIGGSLEHKEINRFHTDYAYYRKDKNGDNTDNKYTQGVLYDWLYPDSRWFYFASGRYDYDEYESWQHRLAAQTGPGYHLISEEFFKLDGRGGLGTRKEWGSDNNDLRLEAVVGLDLDWKLSERQTFSITSSVFPVVTDIQDFRTRTAADWKFLLDQDMKLSFNIGMTHEYQSIVDPDKKRNDLRLYSGIQYNF